MASKRSVQQTFNPVIDFHYDKHAQRLNFVVRQLGNHSMPLQEFLDRADIPIAVLLALAQEQEADSQS